MLRKKLNILSSATRVKLQVYSVLDQQLSKNQYVAGAYSIADMAIYPWLRPHKMQGQNIADQKSSTLVLPW